MEVCIKAAEDLGYQAIVVGNSNLNIPIPSQSFGRDFRFVRCVGPSHAFSLTDGGIIRWPVRVGYCFPLLPRSLAEFFGISKGCFSRYNPRSVQAAIGRLSDDLASLYESLDLGHGDVVVFSTSNEFEVASHAQAIMKLGVRVEWRVNFCFHYGVFPSRSSSRLCTPKARRKMLGYSLRRSFQAMIPLQSNVSVIGLSDEVTKQLEELVSVDAKTLRYPETSGHAWTTELPKKSESKNVMKVGVAAFREEQGLRNLPTLIPELNSIKNTCSVSIPCTTQTREWLLRELPEDQRANCDFIEYPLSADLYSRWVSDCDIILLPYDGDSYSAHSGRCSGIAIDAAMNGKILLVPRHTSMERQLCSQEKLVNFLVGKKIPLDLHDSCIAFSYTSMESLKEKVNLIKNNADVLCEIASQQRTVIGDSLSPLRFVRALCGDCN